MTFAQRILLLGGVLALGAALGLLPRQAASQAPADRSLTDPQTDPQTITQTITQAITQDCGGDSGPGMPQCSTGHSLDPVQATPKGPHLPEICGLLAGGPQGRPCSPAPNASGVVGRDEDQHRSQTVAESTQLQAMRLPDAEIAALSAVFSVIMKKGEA